MPRGRNRRRRHPPVEGEVGTTMTDPAKNPIVDEQPTAAEPGAADAHGDTAPKKKKMTVTRRQVLAMAGCGVGGLVIGGFLASWGVTQKSIASGRIELRTTPTKMVVTDRARCSGCQRCEMMCTLKNDDRVQQSIARVRVRDNYFFGASPDTEDGIYDNCEFTVEHCKQCADPACAEYCPVHAIHSDSRTGARVVDEDVCIGCGMCSQACPWNMPRVDSQTGVSTKCVSCGRCAEQCPNGAIEFVDWQDIAQAVIDSGAVRTVTLVEA